VRGCFFFSISFVPEWANCENGFASSKIFDGAIQNGFISQGKKLKVG